jgi:hypothetical protein
LLELVTFVDIIFFLGGTSAERVHGHVAMVGGCLVIATLVVGFCCGFICCRVETVD